VTLLIVDDHAVNRRLLRAQLEGEGQGTLEASNGAEALALLRAQKVAGVISDILMPEMDGYRLCLEVRKDPALRRLPFVLYTSTYNSPADRNLAAQVGADAYISKPAPVAEILAALGKAAAAPASAQAGRMMESDVLKKYNEALVRKLEERNLALETSVEELQRAEARYRLVFENTPSGIAMTSSGGEVLSANPAMARMLGYETVEEALAALRSSAQGAYVDAARRADYVRVLRQDGVVNNFEAQLRRKDGSAIWASLSGRVIDDPVAGNGLLVSMAVDVTVEKEQRQRIARLSRIKEMLVAIDSAIVRNRERNALLAEACRIALEHGGFPIAWIALLDAPSGDLVPAAWAGKDVDFLRESRLSVREDLPEGRGVAGAAVRTLRAAIDNDIARRVDTGFSRARREAVERGHRSVIGLPLIVDGQAAGVFILYADGPDFFDSEEVALLEGLAADISYGLGAIAKAQQLDFLAYYDALTGLPNRSLFHDRLAHSLQARAGDPVMVAVALIDLQRFRRVNETLGRQAGDELLRQVGARLHLANDTASRFGTDVFALKLRGARSAAEVNRVLEAIIAACFREPFQILGQELRIACRVGVALFPGDGQDADLLLRNAEAALARSRRNGESLVFYAPEMNARVAEALATENRLRRATERREFVLHYQPKVRIDDGRIVGVEALIRWQDPEKGLVPPGQFVPILEETGMIAEVGRWAVQQALADHAAWKAGGCAPGRVAVNVSAIQLQRKDFVDAMIDAVQRAGDDPEALALEITESLLMRDVDASIRKLSILRGMGIQVAMDDFGTGYSSLSYIARLPLDVIKIDRSFVSGVTGNEEDASIVAGIIALVHSLKLRVVAEGVETVEQARHLAGLACDEAQGFYYSRPVPAAQLEALVRAGGVLPATA
jgi:diguanylate cyclase (GGDEF)-like protein/PAS domain S-box-containing protein